MKVAPSMGNHALYKDDTVDPHGVRLSVWWLIIHIIFIDPLFGKLHQQSRQTY